MGAIDSREAPTTVQDMQEGFCSMVERIEERADRQDFWKGLKKK